MSQKHTTTFRRPSRVRGALAALFLGAAMAVAAHAGGSAAALSASSACATEWQQTDPKKMSAKEQYELGEDYYYGYGTVAKDYNEAAKCFRLAAERGHAEAQHQLGFLYSQVQCVGEYKKEAVKWYRLAVEQGVALSQYWLGEMYRDGRGVPQDRDEALKWLRLAAERGHAEAQSE